jgi:SHS2 domain-containing protein
MGSGHAPRWEHFEHGADIGVRGIGATLAASFEQAALALVAVVVDPARIRLDEPVTVTVEAPDVELLLADWLNAVVYQMATRDMVFGRFEVVLDGLRLEGVATGERVDRARHEPAVEVKGATYTALSVRQDRDGAWVAECVVDV